MDGRLPGSAIHGIFQARILEWAAISFSRASSQPRDRTRVSCIADRRLYRLSRQLPTKRLLNEGMNQQASERAGPLRAGRPCLSSRPYLEGHIYAQSWIPGPTPEGAPSRTEAHRLPPVVPAPAPGKDFRGGQGAASLLPPVPTPPHVANFDLWVVSQPGKPPYLFSICPMPAKSLRLPFPLKLA